MNRESIIRLFCAGVNQGLDQETDVSVQTSQRLLDSTHDLSEKALINLLLYHFRHAYQPSSFFNIPICSPDIRFEQCYELMRTTFGLAELELRERYVESLELLRNPLNPCPALMIGRFWETLGLQQYDTDGALTWYSFDPLTATTSAVGVISGSYMSLANLQRSGTGMGAIGHLATRARFRGGQGHGTILLEAFENAVNAIAKERGESTALIVLEAQESSVRFWAKRGFRWPKGSQYAQPPLEFDPLTGERRFDEVPELLMVKMLADPTAQEVEKDVLMEAVRTLYQNWCLARIVDYPPTAVKRATDYVFGKVYANFAASLADYTDLVPLADYH